jgi:hypothetical protein
MSYFMRFILLESAPPTLREIQTVLQFADSSVQIVEDNAEPNIGDLYFGEAVYAELEINVPGDPICDDDLADFEEELSKQDDPNAQRVLDALHDVTGLVAIRVLEAGDDDYPRINWLVDWLFANYRGMLQVDDEGFFDANGRIVSLL